MRGGEQHSPAPSSRMLWPALFFICATKCLVEGLVVDGGRGGGVVGSSPRGFILSSGAPPQNAAAPPPRRRLAIRHGGVVLPSVTKEVLTVIDECCEVIDVRSPGEFAEDHVPGAVNLPVLDDDQRHAIGKMYKEDSYEAKKVGAALVAENIAKHLRGHLADKPGNYRPLVYCWRGGSRSGSLAVVLSQIGWRPELVDGGYKRYRAEVRALLEARPAQLTFRVLGGLTGTGKTALLHHLAGTGQHQVLDLEGLANHRGSTLGAAGLGEQPTQKLFESRLADALRRFHPDRGPVWIEAESSKVGDCQVPSALWREMQAAPRLVVSLPLAVRVERILTDYAYWLEHPAELKAILSRFRSTYGGATVDKWHGLIDAEQWPEVVACLLRDHYDASYEHRDSAAAARARREEAPPTRPRERAAAAAAAAAAATAAAAAAAAAQPRSSSPPRGKGQDETKEEEEEGEEEEEEEEGTGEPEGGGVERSASSGRVYTRAANTADAPPPRTVHLEDFSDAQLRKFVLAAEEAAAAEGSRGAVAPST